MIRKNCIICEKEIHRASNPKRSKVRRQLTGVTCSRDCARIYRRVHLRIRKLLVKKGVGEQ
ncbi:hypothetical protein LCGC14_0912310 [marine sediment metagenome]|uniref:Uncharacterized protein n=1 Tax=marine sediment metagenome TaxID=412755 RepID=A0A0F9NXV7_9ZZZZ